MSSTTRRVLRIGNRHLLAIVIRSYEQWPVRRERSVVVVKLDTRGGPLAESRLVLYNGREVYCGLYIGNDRGFGGSIGRRPHSMKCKIAMRYLDANKRIRWKVLATTDGTHHSDYAPNSRGWYG